MKRKLRIIKAFLRYTVNLLSLRQLRYLESMVFKVRQFLDGTLKRNNALILYHSQTGNTEKVALAIKKGLKEAGLTVSIKKIEETKDEDLYKYDLICFGSPVMHALPPTPVLDFIKHNHKRFWKDRSIVLGSPKYINNNALVFCTYSGPHCGLNEALPVGKYIRQFFEHLGFDVKGEWYEVGEFHGWERGSTKGRLGNIVGRPNAEDLKLIELKTIQLAKALY